MIKTKKISALLLSIMITISNIAPAFADTKITEEPIPNKDIINQFGVAVPYEVKEGENIEDLIKNPEYSEIYTYRWNYRVPLTEGKDTKMKVAYQPYVASVGADATKEEKDRINKKINLPEISGYDKPDISYDVNYDYIKNNATEKVGDSNVLKYGNENFDYAARDVKVEVEYRFRNLYDKNKFDRANDDNDEVIRKFDKKTGDKFELPRLTEEDEKKYAQGFVPEANKREVVVSDNEDNSHFIFRYNRKLLKVNFDTDGGSYIPNMTLYYGQTIPYVKDKPTKVGSKFQGWQADKDIKIKDGKTIRAGELINMDEYLEGFNEAMPAEDLTFTAKWEEQERANYTVQFYVEKPDGGYEFVDGLVKEGETGKSPDLSEFKLKNERFPEIENLVNEPGFNLEKYYKRNTKKTTEENKDEEGNIKTIQANGETYYSIYYDRQTYTLIFEKAVDLGGGHPEVEARMTTLDGTVYDSTDWQSLYKQTVRFGQRIKWPEDRWLIPQESDTESTVRTEMEKGNQLLVGWFFNESVANGIPAYLDTPPYFMTSNDFIDAVNQFEGIEIEFVKNSTSTGKSLGEREISIGPAVIDHATLYYVEFEMEDVDSTGDTYSFDPYYAYTKTDTDNNSGYGFPIPSIPGFEVVRKGIVEDDPNSGLLKAWVPELENNEQIKDIINNRPADQISYFTDFANSYNGVDTSQKGRIPIKYKRNRHKLQFNTDPRDINPIGDFDGSSFFNGTSAVIDEFAYDRPYRNELFERDKNGNFVKDEDGKYVLKEKYKLDDEKDKPEGMPDSYKFLGWATDPSGENLIEKNIEKVEVLEKQIQGLYEELHALYDFSPDAYDDRYFEDEENKAKAASIEAKKKLIQEKKEEIKKLDHTMPNFATTLFAKWGEPVKKRTVSFDFNLPEGDDGAFDISEGDIATNPGKDIVETSQGPRENTPPKKLDSSTATVKNFKIDSRLSIKEPTKPKKKGYDFLGWGLITYNEDGSEDRTYKEKYGVPRLYSFENEIISDIKLRAIWIKSSMVDVKEIHHLYGLDYNKTDVEINGKVTNIYEETIKDQIVGQNAVGYGRLQGEKYILINPKEFTGIDETKDAKKDYDLYLANTGRKNTYYQNMIAEEYDADKEDDPYYNKLHFYYRPYRNRIYHVNYLLAPNDATTFKTVGDPNEGSRPIYKYRVRNANRDYDAVNYGLLPGFKLVSDSQLQLFFNVEESTHKLLGINGIESDQVNFYYRDIRILKRKNKTPAPIKGYHRITFKADEGGSFGTDDKGDPIKEIYYDVIEGLDFKNIPVPKTKEDSGTDKKGELITPDPNYKFIKWEDSALLDDNTVIRRDYTFTAKFDTNEDVIEITTGDEDVPPSFVDVYVDSTELADGTIADNKFTGAKQKHFKVNPKVNVTIPVKAPTGGLLKDKEGNPIKDANGKTSQWIFTKWYDKDEDTKVWTDTNKIEGKFTKDKTYLVAKYSVKQTELEKIYKTDPIEVFESIKDNDGNYINNFIPTQDIYDKVLEKITSLDKFDSYKILDSDDEIYNKLKEDGSAVADQSPRKEQITVEVSFKDGKKSIVNIPVKVYKNIYRALDSSEKPDVVKNNEFLKDFVKVTVNPTTKAKDPQKSYYYVNPKAKVRIPEDKKPEGVDKYTFEKWTSAPDVEGKTDFDMAIRHEFKENTVITARYTTETKPLPQEPSAEMVTTYVGNQPELDIYKQVITAGRIGNTDKLAEIEAYEITKYPNVDQELLDPKTEIDDPNNPGKKVFKNYATVKVIYKSGDIHFVDIPVKVLDKIKPVENENDIPKGYEDYVLVTVDPTDNAVDSTKKYYRVRKNVEVTIPATDPTGKDGHTFVKWDKDLTARFNEDTTITAIYRHEVPFTPLKPIPEPNGGVIVTFRNDRPAVDLYRQKVKYITKDENGNPVEHTLGEKDTLEFIEGKVNADTVDVSTLGDKKVPVRIIFEDGSSATTEVTVRVIDKVYPEGTTDPIPDGYVNLYVIPTEDNKDNVQRAYKVSPDVLINILNNGSAGADINLPKISPVKGKSFLRWTIQKGINNPWNVFTEGQHQFNEQTNYIVAKFVDNVVSGDPDETRPDVPDDFVKVVVIRDKDTINPKKNVYWVKKDTEVSINEFDGLTAPGFEFDGWEYKDSDNNTKEGFTFNTNGVLNSHTFSAQTTTITAKYKRCETCQKPDPNPGTTPTPTPDPGKPGENEGPEDGRKDPDTKEETPDKEKTPEKPGENPEKPGESQPPVENDTNKKPSQTGTKIVKTINQTGTKVINQVKNFLNPTTGIITNYEIYIGLMAASSVGLFFTREKKNKDEE